MKKEDIKLYDLVDLTNLQSILNELKYIVSLMVNDFDHALFEQIYADIKMLFEGDFPGYRASNTKYHDLEHTSAVVLAAARLMHGAFAEGHSFSAKTILLGLIGAIFHDIGFIQADSDVNGSGAKYTIGHEERSIRFMKEYLSQKSFSKQDIEDCTHIIMCTILSLEIKDIPFSSNDIAMLGKIVGSADLLAQMADREYLEKLFMLFKEFEEADMPGYGSELELLQKTQGFYENVALQRLSQGFENVSEFMRSHFKSRWDLDRDLYQESIVANINYLKIVVSSCDGSYGCYLKYLRRGGLAEKLNQK
jgi:HD superfamily phosphodiesterase